MSDDKNLEKVVGEPFEELDTEDMEQTQGAGDVNAETAAVLSLTAVTSPLTNKLVTSATLMV
ncbi:MAG: lichenicidin A2 family type 2 lantibiotic [Pseudobutyrivibrio sp.]|nr:lichenicidin A2 family type 2 lantibiotic [Pseudobutyrivibrio sp.]